MASYLSDFNVADGAVPAGQLEFLSGSGTIVSNRLRLAAGSPVKLAVRPENLTRDNYVVSAVFNAGAAVSAGQRFGVALRVAGTGDYYYVAVKPGAFGNVYAYRVKSFSQTLLSTMPSGQNVQVDPQTDYTLEVAIEGDATETRLTVTFNGVTYPVVVDNVDPIAAPGRSGIYVNDAAGDSIDVDDLSIVEGQATPVVTITEDNATVMADLNATTYPYTFNATATDEEDGDLTANIVWTLSLDGGPATEIGTGASVSQDLAIGSNVITATVTDSNLTEGTDTVTIVVQAFDFGGITPLPNGFIAGIAGTHTADTYEGNGVRAFITAQQGNGEIFVKEDGSLIFYPDSANATSTWFDYKIVDQRGVSFNSARITLNITPPTFEPTDSAFPLDDDGSVAGASGFLYTPTSGTDSQTVVATQDQNLAASAFVNLRTDPFGANAVALADIKAFGYELISLTSQTSLSPYPGGGLCGPGFSYNAGANTQIFSTLINSNGFYVVSPDGAPDITTQAIAGTDTLEIAVYFNAAVQKFGFIVGWNGGNYRDGGYIGTITSSFAPYLFADNDAAAAPALDGTVVTHRIWTDSKWLARFPLPIGAKTLTGITI